MSTELEREGLLWLARQLAWEGRFGEVRRTGEGTREVHWPGPAMFHDITRRAVKMRAG